MQKVTVSTNSDNGSIVLRNSNDTIIATFEAGNYVNKEEVTAHELLQYARIAAAAINADGNPDTITDTWSIADVVEQATRNETPVTNDQAKEILALVGKRKDAEVGINWAAISCQIDLFFEEHPAIKQGFIVVLNLFGGSCQPIFQEDENLMFFDSVEAAQKEIDECISDVAEAVKNGDMSDEYTQDDYSIVSAQLDGNTITCIVDIDRYTMQITDEDFTIIE